jgi:hypothetical protein
MSLTDLQKHPDFDLKSHSRKWIAAELEMPGRDDRMPLTADRRYEMNGAPEFGVLQLTGSRFGFRLRRGNIAQSALCQTSPSGIKRGHQLKSAQIQDDSAIPSRP